MINNTTSQNPDCQLTQLAQMHESLGRMESLWQLRDRFRRIFKRRLTFLTNLIHSRKRDSVSPTAPVAEVIREPLKPGEWVRVRSREDIQATLGNWNNLKGCTVMEEMWHYCGTTQQVLKRVERFLDERDYHTKKIRGIVILDRVNCQGTVDFGPCDRNCFFFWREEWLEKIE